MFGVFDERDKERWTELQFGVGVDRWIDPRQFSSRCAVGILEEYGQH